MGIKICGKENNQIAVRNTDYLFSGKSIIENKNIETTNRKHFLFNHALRTERGPLNVIVLQGVKFLEMCL